MTTRGSHANDDTAGRRSWRGRALQVVLVLAVVFMAAWYAIEHSQELLTTLAYRPLILLPLAIVELSLLVARALLLRSLCGVFNVSMGVIETSRLAAWTSLANYVTPFVGGTGLRGVYLKRQHGLPYAQFVSVQAATYTLHFMVSSSLALASLLLLPAVDPFRRNALAGVFVAILLGCGILHRWPFNVPRGDARVIEKLRQIVEGWQRIRDARPTSLLGLLLANAALQVIAIRLSFALVGSDLGAVQAVFISALYSLSILVAITPASLGISEGAVVLAATICGLSGPTALLAAAGRRVVALAMTFVAVLASSRRREERRNRP